MAQAERRRKEEEERKKEQEVLLGKKGARPKLSFSLG